MTKTQVRPFLMFEGTAEAAMDFYVSVFDDARIVSVTRYGPGEMGSEGSIMTAVFEIGGQHIMCIDSPVKHQFTFTPAISLFVDLESEARLDETFAKLAEGGQVLMPLGAYPFSRKYGWLADKFGVSWQLNLAAAAPAGA
jgi:predicted 3-demethylubiquinone-9 3-methyltransferase (glyoxalase superfamily)